MQTRRKVLATIGSVAAGGTIITHTTQNSRAMAVSMDGLNIPDTTEELSNDVAGVVLQVNGRYQYETTVNPTRLVLRLEAKPLNGSWGQLDAFAIRQNLTQSQSDDYSLQGALTKHPELSAADFTPANRGESKSVQLDVRVRMSVSNEGRVIGRREATDRATITVEKTTAKVDMSVSGSGSVGITTEESS